MRNHAMPPLEMIHTLMQALPGRDWVIDTIPRASTMIPLLGIIHHFFSTLHTPDPGTLAVNPETLRSWLAFWPRLACY